MLCCLTAPTRRFHRPSSRPGCGCFYKEPLQCCPGSPGNSTIRRRSGASRCTYSPVFHQKPHGGRRPSGCVGKPAGLHIASLVKTIPFCRILVSQPLPAGHRIGAVGFPVPPASLIPYDAPAGTDQVSGLPEPPEPSESSEEDLPTPEEPPLPAFSPEHRFYDHIFPRHDKPAAVHDNTSGNGLPSFEIIAAGCVCRQRDGFSHRRGRRRGSRSSALPLRFHGHGIFRQVIKEVQTNSNNTVPS